MEIIIELQFGAIVEVKWLCKALGVVPMLNALSYHSVQFSSVQLLSRVQLNDISNYWTIASSVIPFSFCPQSLPEGLFQWVSSFAWGGQSTGVSASASVLPMNTQDWPPLGWTGWVSLQSKGLSRVFSDPTVQNHQFFSTQLSLQSNSHIHTWLLEKPKPWLDGPLLAK